MPAARLGLHYYKSGIARYVSRLGVDNAKKLFLTAQKIDAQEMLRIGYLTAMVPAEALDEEVDRLASMLAGNAPVAMRGMKRTINEFARGKLDEAAADRARPRQHAQRRDQGRRPALAPRSGRRSFENSIHRHGRARPGHRDVLLANGIKDVDARDKRGHDDF